MRAGPFEGRDHIIVHMGRAAQNGADAGRVDCCVASVGDREGQDTPFNPGMNRLPQRILGGLVSVKALAGDIGVLGHDAGEGGDRLKGKRQIDRDDDAKAKGKKRQDMPSVQGAFHLRNPFR